MRPFHTDIVITDDNPLTVDTCRPDLRGANQRNAGFHRLVRGLLGRSLLDRRGRRNRLEPVHMRHTGQSRHRFQVCHGALNMHGIGNPEGSVRDSAGLQQSQQRSLTPLRRGLQGLHDKAPLGRLIGQRLGT